MKLPWVIIKPWNMAVSGYIGLAMTGPWAFDSKLLLGVSALMVIQLAIATGRAALRQKGET
ncbi:hypothetical protein G3A39_42840 [Paraburkholderia aspalathi]|nr:hypothetical protein [Paraburkholderia aspalathi]